MDIIQNGPDATSTCHQRTHFNNSFIYCIRNYTYLNKQETSKCGVINPYKVRVIRMKGVINQYDFCSWNVEGGDI
jgi:hypothetical protein